MRIVVAVPVFVPLVSHVVHRAAVAFAKRVAIVTDEVALHRGVLVGAVIVRIAVAMFIEIPASRLDAVVESRALCIAIFRRSLVPTALSLVLRL